MRLIQIDHNPSSRQLNVFGFIWLVFFGILGGFVVKGGGSIRLAVFLWCLATIVPAVGWTLPRFMRIVYLGMAYLTFPVGFVTSFLVLAIVYYVFLTPIGLAMRLFGYDPVHRRFDRNADTYWSPRVQDDSLNTYFRQF